MRAKLLFEDSVIMVFGVFFAPANMKLVLISITQKHLIVKMKRTSKSLLQNIIISLKFFTAKSNFIFFRLKCNEIKAITSNVCLIKYVFGFCSQITMCEVVPL